VRWFVTGTDTDVGKTVATACLAAGAGTRGSVIAAKAVASGAAPGTAGEDAMLLGAAAGHPALVFATWEAAISPHRAAERESRPLDVPELERWASALSADTVLLEGAGGWRVPLAPGFDVADLARGFGAPVIVVAADRLGVLNHTRLTVEAIARDGLAIAGIVLVRRRSIADRDPSIRSNEEDLRQLLGVPVAVLGEVDPWSRSQRIAVGLALWRDLT
jgi:dethiobiotin synthetase